MSSNRETFLEVDFSYLADPKLRDIVQQFHREAVDAYRSGSHATAVILSGAVLEGILTFALMRRESDASKTHESTECKRKHRIPEWRLEELIGVSVELGLLGRSAANVAPVVRDFRNMIHPYRLLRRSKPRWDALAPMTLAAVAEISRSLGDRIRTG